MEVWFTSTVWHGTRTADGAFVWGLSLCSTEEVLLRLEAGFEYSYVFRSGLEFSIIQKNNVNFLHGDTFRNGVCCWV